MQRSGTLYTIVFAAVVCVICSVIVSAAAVGLKDKQLTNALAFKQGNVLIVAGLADADAQLTPARTEELFKKNVRMRLVDFEEGVFAVNEQELIDSGYDPDKAVGTPGMMLQTPANPAQVTERPRYAVIYEVVDDNGVPQMLVLPVRGKGLWSTMHGFLALAPDTTSILGLTFYQHAETPGLGGEIDNPKWKSLWPGRKAYDEQWEPAILVVKGQAVGPPDVDPHKVDSISGATITSRGVQNLINFWMGEYGYGPFLAWYREQQGSKA